MHYIEARRLSAVTRWMKATSIRALAAAMLSSLLAISAGAQGVPSSGPSAVVEASIRAMDAAMNAPASADKAVSMSASGVASTTEGQALYAYDNYRVAQFRIWAARHGADFSKISAWSTFNVKSVEISGNHADVSIFETLHIDSTIRDNGKAIHFSPDKQAELAILKKEGRVIGAGQVIHTTVGTLHTVDLILSPAGWQINKDLYWDPLVQSLASDHKTLIVGSPNGHSRAANSAPQILKGGAPSANPTGAARSGASAAIDASPNVESNYSYNRQGAVRYADIWWNTINPAYPSYMSIGEDCANFVSQCLHDANGGQLRADTYWYINSYDWINADGLYNHAVANFSSGNYSASTYAAANTWQKANFYPGDIEFFHWNDSGSAAGVKDHTAICVALDANGNSLMDCHTTNTHHALWDLGWASHTANWYFMCMNGLSGTYSDNANYVADVTIPDGTVLAPGQAFTKTWSMKNTGTTTWGSTYHWSFDSGDLMRGESPGSVPALAAGTTGNISANLVAPTTPGAYTGYWRMSGPHGEFGDEVSVKIVVQIPAETPPSVAFDTTYLNKWLGPSGLNTHVASWTLTDTGGGNGGFSQNWDSSPASSSPTSAGASSGYMTFADIPSGQRQGKHTAFVRAWSKDLQHGGVASSAWYGYDALPPTVAITTGQPDGTIYNTPQHIAFHVSDPDSGVAGWGAAWDTDPAKQSTTSDGGLDLAAGTHTLNVHVWDNVGNEHDYTFGPFTYQAPAPKATWTAISIAAGSDGKTRLLWTKADGSASFWTVDGAHHITYSQVYGPFAGWTARKIGVSPSGAAEIFWVNSDNSVSIWTVSAAGAVSYSPTYGPYTGWTPVDFSVGADGSACVLWNEASGASRYTSISAAGAATTSAVYGPFTGWTASHIAVGPHGDTRLLWNSPNGAASYWTITAASSITYSAAYGPFAGWSCTGIGVGADGKTRLQWNNGGATSFWTIDGAGHVACSQVWGPYAGWSPADFAVAPDGSVRFLWHSDLGAASYWCVGAGYGVQCSATYGPF